VFGKVPTQPLFAAVSLQPLPTLIGKHQITLPRYRRFEIGWAAAVTRKEIDDKTRKWLAGRMLQ